MLESSVLIAIFPSALVAVMAGAWLWHHQKGQRRRIEIGWMLDDERRQVQGRFRSICNQTQEAEREIERVGNKIASAERHLQETVEHPARGAVGPDETQRAVSEALLALESARGALDSAKKLARGATKLTGSAAND